MPLSLNLVRPAILGANAHPTKRLLSIGLAGRSYQASERQPYRGKLPDSVLAARHTTWNLCVLRTPAQPELAERAALLDQSSSAQG
ncbi:MAG: hypothetical protein K2Y24_06935 [Pseudomonadaceae bacterium]|uniref:hypothetical protein n=1 Tax=Pseudomonas sp. Ga0074129 TaxID=1752219 RepID=UPI0025D7455C|nr:hypothetical protein [Pseudomonas sp. Ga0074129]MBX9762752.1 hypothetical protein [Pseudomonadaceae bacterium]